MKNKTEDILINIFNEHCKWYCSNKDILNLDDRNLICGHCPISEFIYYSKTQIEIFLKNN